MKTVNLKHGNSFRIHETQKQLPINRYTDFQKYVLQDAGIGSTLADIDRHFQMLHSFLGAGKVEEAARESHNMHINLYLAINKISTKNISFACLIESINDKPITDFSESNLIQVCNALGEMGLTDEMLSDLLGDLKKNLILN